MSSKSIALYQAHAGRKPAPSITPRCMGRNRTSAYNSRTARTEPPPPMATQASDVRSQAAALRAAAARILARAEELEESADRMSDTERDVIESGCIDSDDPRHPNHPLCCAKPCCSRRDP